MVTVKSMSKRTKAVMGVLVALMVVGFGCWVYQQVAGLGITGMSNGTSWGLYICLFLFAVGLSAGGLIVASAGSVFHIEDYEKVALPAVIASLSCILVAAGLVLCDLGNIKNIPYMLVSLNITSPLAWDLVVITCYIVLNILELVFLTSAKEGARRKVWVVSCIALPVAILVHSVTAWILGLQIGRDWYSSIMAPLFVVSAMDSGLGLLILALLGMNKTGWFMTPKPIISKLALLLAVVVAVDAYMVGVDLLVEFYPGEEHVLATLHTIVFGSCAPAFWLEVICLAAAFLMLASKKRRQNMGVVGAASALVVLSVLCKRIWLLFSGFKTPNIDWGPGISSGSLSARQSAGDAIWATASNYAVQLPELMIAIAVFSFGVFLFVLLVHKLVPKYLAVRQLDERK